MRGEKRGIWERGVREGDKRTGGYGKGEKVIFALLESSTGSA